jgi:PAS domain S-box-containing protein
MNNCLYKCALNEKSGRDSFSNDTGDKIHYLAFASARPRIICFSEKTDVLTGYCADEILATKRGWEKLVHPKDKKRLFAALRRCKAKGTAFEIEYRIIDKKGALRYVRDKARPVYNIKDKITHIEGAINEIEKDNIKKPEYNNFFRNNKSSAGRLVEK